MALLFSLPLVAAQLSPPGVRIARLTAAFLCLLLAALIYRRDVEGERRAMPAWSWAVAAIAPPAIYLAFFSIAAYRSLFLGDYDFTSLSEAINRTAAGDGALPTVYLSTGNGQSYLGHHFSPILLGYVPIYCVARLFSGSTHLVYALALWLSFVSGLALWHRLATRLLGDASIAALFAGALGASWLLLRQAASFHFEILTLPLSALLFLALQRLRDVERDATNNRGSERRWRIVYWATLLALLAVKEDLGVYLSCFGLYLLSNNRSGLLATEAVVTMALAAGWHLAASQLVMPWFRGGTELNWAGYWDPSYWGDDRRFRPALLALFSFGFAPFLALRALTFAVAPILLLHALSYQPWHNQIFGHYSYSFLPFLAYAALLGLEHLSEYENVFRRALAPAATAGTAALILLSGVWDPYSPAPAPADSPRLPALQTTLREIPPKRGSCLQTQFPFSAHAALQLRLFPLSVPTDNPAYQQAPRRESIVHRTATPPPDCTDYFALLDPGWPMPPYYDAATLADWKTFADERLELRAMEDTLFLYRWPPPAAP